MAFGVAHFTALEETARLGPELVAIRSTILGDNDRALVLERWYRVGRRDSARPGRRAADNDGSLIRLVDLGARLGG